MSGLSVVDLTAYIDAGTGSYILAAIASGVAGMWMFFRSGLSRIRRKLRGESAYVVDVDEVGEVGEVGEATVEAVDSEELRTRD